MAEENNLENEIDAPDDISGDDLDLVPNDNDLETSDDDLNSADDNVENKGSAITTFFSNRRNIVIVAASTILIVGIIVSGLFFRGDKNSNDTIQAMSQQDTPQFDSSSIVNKKKTDKKKKKKVKYIDLYKQLETKQLSPILRELEYLNIDYNVVQNGKQFDLQVDEDQTDEAKHVLAIKGMPSGTARGYEIFDEASNLGVTEFDKRIRLIRALSGEMEKAIMEFDVVDYAYVEIVIPETRLFAATQPPVTSSILIKRQNGKSINDETVYAIIQLVSNSVESLAPENISVVDTEGRVLSTGVLERMENKLKEMEEQVVETKSIGDGKVIIPEISDVVDWFQLKFNYETVLEKKAINQLQGVLPVGSFKAAVTIDLNSVTKTGAPDIKKIVSSVVVDEQFEEVELNEELIAQVTQAVAGAIGFQENRDTIHISKAAFLPKRKSDETESKTFDKQQIIIPQESFTDKSKRFFRLWPIFAIGSVFTLALITIFVLVRSFLLGVTNVIKLIPNIFKRAKKEKDIEEEEKIEIIEEPILTEQDVINSIKSKSDYAKTIQLKAYSTQNMNVLVDQIKELIKG